MRLNVFCAALSYLLVAAVVAALEVTIVKPLPGEPVFGEVEIVAEIYPADHEARLEFFIGDLKVGEVDKEPFRIITDVGEDNLERRFRVLAHGADGDTAEALLVAPAIAVNDVVEAELQQLYATVSQDGSRVLDLEREDFAIVDNGQLQELVTFARGDVRLTAALLIDSSASMKGNRLRYALRGAGAFLEGMKPDDDAALTLFSDRLLYSAPFSNDSEALTRGLKDVRAAGGTALNDHLYLALKMLELQQGRRVVILLSDGIDSHSSLRMPEVVWLARRSRALIYWIRPDPRDEERRSRFSAWKNPDLYRKEYRQLTNTVLESGGRIVTLQSIQDAESAFREILRELREQYVLGYYPSTSRGDGSWHQVLVRLRRSGPAVRAQRGYIDY